MSNGWSASDYSLDKPISGAVTDSPVSREFPISAGGALFNAVKIVAAGVNVAGTITAKLQSAVGPDWVDAKTVTISGNGNFYIKHNNAVAGDQTYLPLLNRGRIVITTTNPADAVTVGEVSFLQAL